MTDQEPPPPIPKISKELKARLVRLTYRELEIIKLRYGIGDGYTYTFEEVGKIFKVTRERVRQVEVNALVKLGKWSLLEGLSTKEKHRATRT